MAPPRVVKPAVTAQQQQQQKENNKWEAVTWMGHTTLSPSSHVGIGVRSAHASIDALSQLGHQDEEGIMMMDASSQQLEWKVRLSVQCQGLPLVPLVCHTPTASLQSRSSSSSWRRKQQQQQHVRRPTVGRATHDCCWDTYVHLPIRWRDLPRDAYLLLEILNPSEVVVYHTTMPFFSQYGRLITGLQKLELTSSVLDTRKNHGLFPLKPRNERRERGPYGHNFSLRDDDDSDIVWKASCILDQIDRFEQRAKTTPKHVHTFGEIPSVPWLDALQKERCNQILIEAAESQDEVSLLMDSDANAAFLIVELPVFDIPVMHEEMFYPIPQNGASGAVSPLEMSLYRKQQRKRQHLTADTANGVESFDPLQMVPFLDYENEDDNPVEDKYRALAHDLLRGLVDPELKPDRAQRDRLAAIIESPSHHPTREEKDLLWRFRFSLVDNRRALTKFLLAVDWTVESEVVQAAELLEQWRKRSPIEVTDALKLLGKHVAFQTSLVRAYAIDTLAAAPDSELRLYLLQLVQALKYETLDQQQQQQQQQVGPATNSSSTTATSSSPKRAATKSSSGSQVSSLAHFLISRAAKNLQLANFLYWYLKVEMESPTHGPRYKEVFAALKKRLSETKFIPPESTRHFGDDSSSTAFKSIFDSVSKLGSSLRGDHPVGEKDRSAKKKTNERSFWDVLMEQDAFISGLLDIQLRARDARGKKDQKETELRSLLSKEGYDRNPQRCPIPLPSSPEILVNGVKPATAKMFKSALYPALVEFHVASIMPTDSKSGSSSHRGSSSTSSSSTATASPSRLQANARKEEGPEVHRVIIKTGDDLRQDQLIIMMIQLMDGLLKRSALDLCLTPYSIIATSPTSGLMHFVDNAMPISQILSTYNGSIMQFFQSQAPMKGTKYDVRPEVMSTYIRSCAGYCVITYLLGVGDRHLDNFLLRPTGHFFHIDFGFIFGRDPKPLPPAFRLTREMVDGMGGTESSEYRQFCSLACQAFNVLRKSAGLVLNLLHLMSDAGIEDLSHNPSADAEGVIAKVEERFRLDLTDEQAEYYFLNLTNDCLAAIAPRVMDVIHSFAVARR